MVNLQLQDILQEKCLTIEELSNMSNVPEESLQAITNNSFQITEENSNILRRISEVLKLPISDLLRSANDDDSTKTSTTALENSSSTTAITEGFKLQILNLAQNKGISLEELSNQTGIHPSVIALYSTQPIEKTKLEEPKLQDYLRRISEVIECRIEDLKLEANLPKTRLQFRELMKDKGLTLEDLSRLTGAPAEAVEFIVTQPLDTASFKDNLLLNELKNVICNFCPICCVERQDP